MKSDLLKLDYGHRLFVLKCGDGYSHLGFDVCEKRAAALASEMQIPRADITRGTREAYDEYRALVEAARQRNVATGWRSASELTPQLAGLEGKRVEVIQADGAKRRFQVGKTTGFIPCHIELARYTSRGGPAIMGAPFKSVRVIS